MIRRSILIITPFSGLWSMAGGGGTTVGINAFDALLRAGYELDIVAPRGAVAGFSGMTGLRVHEVAPPRIRSQRPGLRGLAWFELNVRLFLGALAASRRSGRPRVVYGFSALATPALVATGLCLRRSTVSALFGTFLDPILGHPRSLLRNLPEVIAFKAPVTCLQVLDDGTRGDRVANRLNSRSLEFRFWRHGIDWEELDAVDVSRSIRDELEIAPSVPLLVSSSRLVDWKRVDRIIRALSHVRESYPSAVLAIAGSGPERSMLERLAAEVGVADSIRFLGSLPRAENLRLTAASDVFCSFYDYSNLGVSLIEAMALGVACVVADTGATAEVVEHSVSGLVVPPDAEADAATAILRVLDDRELRSRLGSAATARIRALFPSAAERAKWEVELVAELAGRRGTGISD